MEKKVPEKNVDMKEDDVFYVYEKRINKCAKADCEGVVKYGLVLKVNTGHDETLNCFECNKCHMKYTPYPNFIRLKDKRLSILYNGGQVAEWQLHTKKKEELRKNAAAKLTGAKFGEKKFHSTEQQDTTKKTFKSGFAKKPYERTEGQNAYGKPAAGRIESSKTEQSKSRPFQKNKPYSASKPQTFTVRKGNIIITRTMENAQNDGMQVKRKPTGPRPNNGGGYQGRNNNRPSERRNDSK